MTTAPGLSPVGSEALDDPETPADLVTRMLRDIAVCNRWLGGRSAVRYALRRMLRAGGGTQKGGENLTLFDVGTGAGDLPLDAREYARARGITLRVAGLERIRAAAHLAHGERLPVVVGCAGALPLRAKSVDLVLISQVAHHLDAASVRRLFRSATALARLGVIVADLRANALMEPMFRAVGALLRLHPMTVTDGITSLRRGYSRAELAQLCRDAGITNAQVVTRPGSRVVAWWMVGRWNGPSREAHQPNVGVEA